jgi:hypothetical protein
MPALTVKHIGDGVSRDGAALSSNARSRLFCRKCSLEKPIAGGHTKRPKNGINVFGFVCRDCSPPRAAYVPPPPKPKPVKSEFDRRTVKDPERRALIAAVRGDFELRNMQITDIAAAREMQYDQVYKICNYAFAAYIEAA